MAVRQRENLWKTATIFYQKVFVVQKYKIKNIYDDGVFCSVMAVNSKNVLKTVDLPRSDAKKIKNGDKIWVVQDAALGIEDYVYLYHKGLCFHIKPVSFDKYSCRYYIKNLPGLFDDFKLDRAVFKIALVRESLRLGRLPSMKAWRNLQNVCLLRTYAPLMR